MPDAPGRLPSCEVYWGSHGCHRERGHDPALGHACDCCSCADHERDHEANGCVALPPYYGPDTRFYGDDAVTAPARVASPLPAPSAQERDA